MSSLMRRLRKGHSKDAPKRAAAAAARRLEERLQKLESAAPLPPGVSRKDYMEAMAFLRRQFPKMTGRELHDEAIAACVAYQHEKQVQRVLAGGKS